MQRKLICYTILVILFISVLVPYSTSGQETSWWNSQWSFRKEIIIPIDTSDPQAEFQPVDIPFYFNNTCWALDENENSIRVVLKLNGNFKVLESQIYDLNHTNEEHINYCNIVFLIPEEANGYERYFVYYDDEEKYSTHYTDRVQIGESEYYYEKLPGLVFYSKYYQVKQGEEIIYAITKEGEALEESLSNQILKLKKGTKIVEPDAAEIGVSFDFTLWNKVQGKWLRSSTADKMVKFEVLVDGNLMVKFGIISESNDGLVRTTCIYKYYYCPSEDKRIYTNVKQEIIKDSLPAAEEVEAVFIRFVTTNVRSSTIDELNFGDIPPFLHFNSEDRGLKSFKVDQYPEEFTEQVLHKEDDYDLGNPTWVSYDEGERGIAHGMILNSNEIISSGSNERDGLELQLYKSNYVSLPGIDVRLLQLYITRNNFERDEIIDNDIPEDYTIEYKAEFFSTDKGGYKSVQKEAEIFQEMIKFQPTSENNITQSEEEKEGHDFEATVHFSYQLPMAPYLQWLAGINITYISGELYRLNEFEDSVRVRTASRVKMIKTVPINFPRKNLLKKIRIILISFDWKNMTFFKTIEFKNLEKGQYLLKIFIENPVIGNERKFVGYTLIDLDKNVKARIFCRSEGKVGFLYNDQNSNGIEGVETYLIRDGVKISRILSNSYGMAIIRAPCGFLEEYTLQTVYKGFNLKEEKIKLGRITEFYPLQKSLNFDVYDFEIDVKSSDGLAPTFDFEVNLTSDEMDIPVYIKPDITEGGTYKFNNLYPATYNLSIKYNSYIIRKTIKIPDQEFLSIKLHDLDLLINDNWNLPPGFELGVIIKSEDFEKNPIVFGSKKSQGNYQFSNLYPGKYILEVYYKDFTLKREIVIPEDKKIQMTFPTLINFTATVFDSHGNSLKDADVIFERDGKQTKGVTDGEGNASLTLPPGSYEYKVFYGGELVSQKLIDVFDEETIKIVTKAEPIRYMIVTPIMIILLLCFAFYCYKKKDWRFFLKIFAVSLILISLVSPWWAIQGATDGDHYEKSTKLYLMPTNMVEITSNKNVSCGELLPLDENIKKEIDLIFISVIIEFLFAVDLFVKVMIAGLFLVILSLLFTTFSKRRLSQFSLFLAIIVLVGSTYIFALTMTEMGKTTVGSFIGGGDIEVLIPGEKIYVTMASSWGPVTGFYLLIGAIIILIVVFIMNYRRGIQRNFKKLYSKIKR